MYLAPPAEYRRLTDTIALCRARNDPQTRA
jgi:hypothetical protein